MTAKWAGKRAAPSCLRAGAAGTATGAGATPAGGGSLGAPNSEAATDAGLGGGVGCAGLPRDTSNDWPSAEPPRSRIAAMSFLAVSDLGAGAWVKRSTVALISRATPPSLPPYLVSSSFWISLRARLCTSARRRRIGPSTSVRCRTRPMAIMAKMPRARGNQGKRPQRRSSEEVFDSRTHGSDSGDFLLSRT